jgi:non-ribosomal peptide synthetase component E (peptide arylation enzyme)
VARPVTDSNEQIKQSAARIVMVAMVQINSLALVPVYDLLLVKQQQQQQQQVERLKLIYVIGGGSRVKMTIAKCEGAS